MTLQYPLILASGSPRRRQLLTEAGVSFEITESGVIEVRRAGETAREYAPRMAREKAFAVVKRAPGALVLAADTVVECMGEILEKPADPAEARRMLTMLSARTHLVVTAFALARGGEIVIVESVESLVTFRKLDPAEIESYLSSGEPYDKAGGYGIQGVGGGFISHVEGPRDNVMGLPVANVLAAIRRFSHEG